MRTIRLTLAYDGTNYAGWQVQPEQKTVQGVLETAIEKITGQAVRVIGSGRTDAGVHARSQVAAFQTESELSTDVFTRALNAELPRDVAVLSVDDAPERFHPIRDAVRKRYRYLIHDGPVRDVFRRQYCWHYRRPLDADAMHRAAGSLLGKHDFSSFETSGAERATSVRTIYNVSVERRDGRDRHLVAVEVEADGFLYNMVRAIVGTLVEVGRGAQPESWVAEVLAATDRRTAGPNAPPQGLCLMNVEYEDVKGLGIRD